MTNSLSLYIFYRIDLKNKSIEAFNYAYVSDKNIIKNEQADFPDFKDLQIIDDNLKLNISEDENELIFAKLIKDNIPIATDKNKIKNIISSIIPIIVEELCTKYEIKRIYDTPFAQTHKVELEKPQKNNEKKLDEEQFNVVLLPMINNYIDSINQLSMLKKNVKPSELIEELKRKIIGQDEAIETIVTNVLLNQKLIDMENPDILRTGKTNILVNGPTGVGKTAIISLLAKKLKLPMELASTTNYSTVGYKGDDLNSILVNLLRKTNGNLQKAQRGIICFDEIDKLGDSNLEIRKGLAQELLTWLSGTKIPVVYDHKEYVFDTTNLTFIGLGAFSNMQEKKNVNQIGFSTMPKENETFNNETFNTEDYISFGMSREFMGRMNVITILNPLEVKDLENILINSEISPLKSLIEIIKSFGIDISYGEELPHEIAVRAYAHNIGARALSREVNKIRNKILLPIMEGQIESLTLTSEMLEDNYTFTKEYTKQLKMIEI